MGRVLAKATYGGPLTSTAEASCHKSLKSAKRPGRLALIIVLEHCVSNLQFDLVTVALAIYLRFALTAGGAA
jgi:hypothetical protein